MARKYSHDAIVIGAGAGGLVSSGGLALLGLKVALVEKHAMGGDCLNTGCVPSKALLAAARQARTLSHPGIPGMEPDTAAPDFARVMQYVEEAIARIAPHDSPERFEEMGVEVIFATARMIDAHHIDADGRTLSAPRIILACGSHPFIPPIKGLKELPFLTSETLWALRERPEHLLIIGGGPIGTEMAQSFIRLGIAVTLITDQRLLEGMDEEAAALVRDRLIDEGVIIHEGARITSASGQAGDISLTLENGESFSGSHLLVATGRSFADPGLGLKQIGVDHDSSGIKVDQRLRTTQKHIYAVGDCRPGMRFTHVAAYEGGNIVLEIGYGLPTKADYRMAPRVVYCDPELAQIGLSEAQARAQYGDKISIWREDFADNDRAICEHSTEGFVRLVMKGRKILGATIVGQGAGDLLAPVIQMMQGKASAFALAMAVLPYPNRSEAVKAAVFASQEKLLFNRLTRGWAGLLARIRR